MKYISFVHPVTPDQTHIGAMLGYSVVDLAVVRSWAQGAAGIPAERLPSTMLEFIHAGEECWDYVRRVITAVGDQDPRQLKGANRAPGGSLLLSGHGCL